MFFVGYSVVEVEVTKVAFGMEELFQLGVGFALAVNSKGATGVGHFAHLALSPETNFGLEVKH